MKHKLKHALCALAFVTAIMLPPWNLTWVPGPEAPLGAQSSTEFAGFHYLTSYASQRFEQTIAWDGRTADGHGVGGKYIETATSELLYTYLAAELAFICLCWFLLTRQRKINQG